MARGVPTRRGQIETGKQTYRLTSALLQGRAWWTRASADSAALTPAGIIVVGSGVKRPPANLSSLASQLRGLGKVLNSGVLVSSSAKWARQPEAGVRMNGVALQPALCIGLDALGREVSGLVPGTAAGECCGLACRLEMRRGGARVQRGSGESLRAQLSSRCMRSRCLS